MSESMKIAVLGPVPRDRIVTHNGETFEKYGCATYTAAALSALLGDSGTVHPICHVRRRDLEPVRDILRQFANVELSGITSALDQGDVVQLTYLDQNRRAERQTGFMDPILPEDLAEVLDADAFVCVPITDYQVSRATLKYIKENSKGITILDAHGPTSCLTRNGERHHRFWADRDSWLPYIDILKMNLEEAACSWFDTEYSTEDLREVAQLAMDDLPRFARHCLDRGVKALCVTLDQHGCVVYFRGANGAMQEHVVKRVPVEKVVDTTGCGDSFAGGLAFGYLRHRDFVKACQYGNAVGAQRCVSSQIANYKSLEETERQIAETYGA
ncbi:MAG: carbohydrate kinase family protein [Rhodobacterales bacterium 65-51]|uniref:carbohydrate kinase family protein n=1 Tax=uncultured Gemmobacter sp. TaxID=1095917 RepID=UPI00095E7B01|nr:carbohydrate kinase family protein [uncultured Gemmobacter sp.]OJY31902.1 MAG: carbohydrate kinase family protein [Rhodobacterales bacterium 65-51]